MTDDTTITWRVFAILRRPGGAVLLARIALRRLLGLARRTAAHGGRVAWRMLHIRRIAQRLPASRNRITVVIPVFNAFEQTVACVGGALLFTPPRHRVLVIDDASTDARVTRYLDAMARRHPRHLEVRRNAKNLGFVGSANLGFDLANRSDVILLNSDTIVGPGWSRSLAEAAAAADVASVTAVSNEASAFSVLHDETTALLRSAGIVRLSAAIAARSSRLRPAIPTGVGFCMLFTRRALDRVGGFDATFGRGYGEENDWCMRALAAGMRHVLDDACFTYHEGHVSMRATGYLPEGADLLPGQERILLGKHPHYAALVADFLASNADLPAIRSDARAAAKGIARRRTVGFLVHRPIDGRSIGGTEFHVADLVRHLRTDTDCIVLHPEDGGLAVTIHEKEGETTWRIPCSGSRAPEEEWAATLRLALRLWAADLLHVQHALGTGFSMIDAAANEEIPVVFSMHDRHALGWTPGTSGMRPDAAARIAALQPTMERLAAVIAPSEEPLAEFRAAFPRIARSVVIPHGIDHVRAVPARTDGPPTVCFLSATHNAHKGRDNAAALAFLLRDAGVRSVFLGSGPEQIPELYGIDRITLAGVYRRDDLHRLLAEAAPDLVIILSAYPESHCYALDEAWAAGIPVYATDAGALGSRIRRHGGGRLARHAEPARMAEDILGLLAPETLAGLRAEVRAIPRRSGADMAADHRRLYDEILVKSADRPSLAIARD